VNLAMFYERAFLQFDHRLLQLAGVVHNDGSVAGDRLFDWLTGDEQEANPFRSGLDDDHTIRGNPIRRFAQLGFLRQF
jgi:hypothetical protein